MKLFLFFLLAYISKAFCILQYPLLLPQGELEALMANTGAALKGSTGGVIYNPASLSEIQGSKVNAGVNTYNFIDSQNVTDQGVKSFNTFTPIPTTLFYGTKFGSSFLALSIIIPESLKVNSRFVVDQSTSGDVSGNLVFSETSEEQLINISWASHLSENFSLGISGTYYVFSEESTSAYIAQGAAGTESKTLQQSLKVSNLLLNLGIQHTVSPVFTWGLTAKSPSKKLSGSGNIFTETLDSSSGTPVKEENDYSTNHDIPWDFILGLNLNSSIKSHFFIDIGYQLAEEFDAYSGLNTSKNQMEFKNQGR